MKRAIAALLVAVGTVGGAQAQEPVLKGPSTPASTPKTTLVEREFNGGLKRLEIPPEEAALGLLSLDDETKIKTDRVITERAAILDKVVIENLELVGQIHNAGQSGDKAEAVKLFQEFAKKLEPLKARGKLVDEIAEALPTESRDRYRALVKEYHEAAVKDTETQAAAKGEKLRPREAAAREVLQAIGKEIKRSYDRQIASRSADYERLLAGLDLKAEQERRIRSAVTDSFQQTKGNPTAEQRRALFWKIYGELDREQQKKLIAYYRGGK